jgi:hypothetical protein
MLAGKSTVLWNPTFIVRPSQEESPIGMNLPVSGIMWLFQRVANTCVPCSKYPFSLAPKARWIKLQIHQLVHILQNQHIAIQLHYAVIFDQAERRQLRPTVIEARIRGIVLPLLWEQVLGPPFRDSAGFEHSVPFRREGIGVQGYEGVLGTVLLEAVVQREEAIKIFCVGD